ncbi:hypothetical protein OQJ19_07080 [Fluoribacter gormanii]|uniref:Uncharacterized protein n=1 Tax=Fluoribacter gormanii TaxID=464 RepID=A0A377GEH5_9GAMM|nr:lpg0008 family Dot/Icm T4SS effector [Fluoribacter gormanii]KTD00478.1 hypothetical protein Lgor_2954 [Fluoribacter gormanii]MCW8445209.1 hypothetical protein [Fluoribacter gormanii]MCW8470418.1 hypothetical protein [Fluoribacter gormanii]SIR09571.1 hypothetical protein SAMN05421777_106105 [Fluoribacter gormanii]STO23220.1 Uncharacterised protein [Fluoribacter gormanii]
MAFTRIELTTLKNPYEHLSDGDALAKNAKELNALSAKEQVSLATKIIAACPDSMFKQYGHHIKSLGNLATSEETFHSVITEAYQVRQRITSLLDPRNKEPHALFSGKEFNPAPFHRFSALAEQVLESNESAIAERFALCTPEHERSHIAHNISTAFPKHILAEKTQIAFMLRRNIERLLLGDAPEKFFTSRDFNKETCKMFVNLFRTLLKGHEVKIGEKLGALESQTQASIKRNLELLHTEAFDETNPFKLIADSMSAKESIEQKKNESQATNPNSLFKSSFNMSSRTIQTKEELESSSDADEEELSDFSEEEEYEGAHDGSPTNTWF